MNPLSIDLNAIAVKSPCTVSWSGMTGDDRSRFCKLCKLNVYNISAMTQAEAEALLAEREGRLCVRYFRRADGTIMTRDCAPARIARARRIFAVTAATVALMAVNGLAWFARRQTRGENFDAHQSFQTSRSSLVYQRLPLVRNVVDWAQQQVDGPDPMIMGKVAVMGDVAIAPPRPAATNQTCTTSGP